MTKPTVFSGQSEVDILNDVLMMCQLPIVNGAVLNDGVAGTDAFMAYKWLIRTHRALLSEGQWFNTVYDFEIAVSAVGTFILPLPNNLPVPKILGLTNARPIPGESEEFTRFLQTPTENIVQTFDAEPSETIGKVDIRWAIDMTKCPVKYLEYLTARVASEYAAMIGVAFNNDLLFRAERDWMIENNRNLRVPNLFCPEYAN